jgi:small nuclear ribonucleoprotein (snRNP)-like protein
VGERHSTGRLRGFDEVVNLVLQPFIPRRRSYFPNKFKLTDATNDCPQNSLEDPKSKSVQIKVV